MIGTTRPLRRARLTALAALAGLALAACGTTDDTNSAGDSSDGSSTGANCQPTTLAFLGPTTGPYANLGINIVDGAKGPAAENVVRLG